MKRPLRDFGMLVLIVVIPALAHAGQEVIYAEPGAKSIWVQSRTTVTTLLDNVKGAFWRNPAMVTSLGLTADQQQKMEEIFRQHRISLIDLNAAVEKEE